MIRRITLVTWLALYAVAAVAKTPGKRDVDLKASDGAKLKATFYSAGKAGPGVLMLHQCNKDRKIWDGLAQQLAAAGVNVLTFDLRDFGESDGPPMQKLTPEQAQAAQAKWPSDVDAAFAYLTSQPGVKRDDIGLAGASCGVDNAVQAARRHDGVKSLVLLAGPTNLAGRNFLRQTKTPVLYGYADDDEFPPSPQMTQWEYSLTASAGKKLVRYPDGGHGAEIFSVHPEFVTLIRDWFVTTTIKTPGEAPAGEKAEVPAPIEFLNVIDAPGGAQKASQMLAEARAKDPKATLFPEDIVNVMGYEHLQSGDKQGAIEILKLNAEAYPQSANVYDSLSDAYLANGQKDLALMNVKRALETLETDTAATQQVRDGIRASCEQKLKQLGAEKN